MTHTPHHELAAQAREHLASVLARKEPLKPKDRMAIPAQPMPAQHPHERRWNVSEVALGYTPEQARLEALRCLQCLKPTCIDACPLHIDIKRFIMKMVQGDPLESTFVGLPAGFRFRWRSDFRETSQGDL